ncbi:MAG: hypothetical protein EA384_11330 [Spirochaetaceae bacterium]|nr:MAG: hypothetical protein EA384_11330 [Spirochaetaceae bacterium]
MEVTAMKGNHRTAIRIVCLITVLTLAAFSAGALDTVVGETGLMLNGLREHVRSQETNLGNLVTDVLRQRTGADIAVYNGGGIRASAEMGEITLEAAMDILAFQNDVVTLQMTGAQVVEMIEHGISAYPDVSGRFLQVSGIRFYFNPARPAGQRITRVFVGDSPLVRNRNYTVATNEFLAAGGDGYAVLEQARQLEIFDIHDQAMFIQYLQQNSPVFPRVEGRIVIER